MDTEEIKSQIMRYVQTIETNYNDTIRDLKDSLFKEQNKHKKSSFQKVGELSNKN